VLDFFKTLFRPQPSSATAKERLRLVLLSDHLSLAPDVIESLKADLLEVIRKYVVIDEQHADVTFEHREHEIAMLASIPIVSVNGDRPTPPPQPTPLRPPAPVAAASVPAAVTAEATPVASPAQADVAGAGTRPRRRRRRKRTADGQPALGQAVQLQA
jgi:cell division topological specificity factor